MTSYMFILTIATIVIVSLALGYTISIARLQKRLHSELDTPIPERVQERVYIRNPVFLAYLAFFLLLLLIIVFVATNL